MACGISETSFLRWQHSSGCQCPRIVSLKLFLASNFFGVLLMLKTPKAIAQIPAAVPLKNLNTKLNSFA